MKRYSRRGWGRRWEGNEGGVAGRVVWHEIFIDGESMIHIEQQGERSEECKGIAEWIRSSRRGRTGWVR